MAKTKPRRDKKSRIELYAAIEIYMIAHPDVRVAQALVNVLPARLNGDPYYVENDDLTSYLKDYSGAVRPTESSTDQT